MCSQRRSILRGLVRCFGLSTLGALVLPACDSLTEVDAPDVRVPEDYATSAGASALATGAVTLFLDAFGGSIPNANTLGLNQVSLSGLMADELSVTSHTIGSQARWDRRDPVEPASGTGGYVALQQARINLFTAIASMQSVAPDSAARIGELFALTGYTEIFLGENFCAGVPLSNLDASFSPAYGQPLTTEQMYEQAVADFDSALVHGGGGTVHLASVGKARALLDLGEFSGAAATVANVPTTYVYNATYATGVLHNGGYALQNWYTVPEAEGTNGLDWQTAHDPRVQVVNRSPDVIGLDGETEIWAFVRYQTSDAPIALATGIEARLIEAEAALQADDPAGWLALHNAIRATVPGLDPLVDPGTASGRIDSHFRERAFWLFLTGHRHGDLRRLVRQYGRDVETVFPIGDWRAGQRYGTATNFALPAEEFQNPNYTGCLSREA